MQMYSIQLNQQELNDDYFKAELNVFKIESKHDKSLIFNRNINFCWYKKEGLNQWCNLQTKYSDIAEKINQIELTKDPAEKNRLSKRFESDLQIEQN